jgi:histidyl-tRNA synthetase
METVKGFNDVSGEEALKRERIKEIIVGTFKLYGFEPSETPVIEYEEFVKEGNQSDEAVSDIFKLQDKGKRNLALRYEFTFQLKRIARNKKLPYKRYQIGEVFRDEPVSSNRFRQFTQCDADIIGSSVKEEAEVLALTSRIFKELRIDSEIYVNNRKLMSEILDGEKISNKEAVIKEIDKLDKLPEKAVLENLKKYKAEKILSTFKKPKGYFKKYKAYSEISELKKYCDIYKIKINFQPSLARGLSYYTGNVFEIKTKDIKESIGAGGSYLVNGIQSTGISFGLDRVASLAKIKTEEKRAVIISIAQEKKAIETANRLRERDIPVILMYKVSNALEYANSSNIPYVVFIGEKEIKQKKFKLRDMKSGKEKMLAEEELIKTLKS